MPMQLLISYNDIDAEKVFMPQCLFSFCGIVFDKVKAEINKTNQL